MATKNGYLFYVLLLIVVSSVLFGFVPSRAQVASTPPIDIAAPQLSGSGKTIENVLSTTDIVFTGEVIKIGPPQLKAAGQSAYHGVQVKILQQLLGSINDPAVVEIHTTYRLNEQAPEKGSCLYFLRPENSSLEHGDQDIAQHKRKHHDGNGVDCQIIQVKL